MPSPLSIKNICKSYGKNPVLQHMDLELKEGEIFGLIGLNGAGKTTLIKIILDLARPDDGKVTIFDEPSQRLQARQHVSYLPEKFQPSRYLKGMEYLSLSLSYYGRALDKEQAREKVAALDLNPDALTRQVRSYSKGMGQKLGLAGAFLADTPLLILDEPMSGLDPRARIALKRELVSLRQKGKTVFFSSHILSDIEEICDRIGIIHGGHLFFVGTPAEFRSQYHGDTLEKAFLHSLEKREAA